MNALPFTFRIPEPDPVLDAEIASAGPHQTARSSKSRSSGIRWLENVRSEPALAVELAIPVDRPPIMSANRGTTIEAHP